MGKLLNVLAAAALVLAAAGFMVWRLYPSVQRSRLASAAHQAAASPRSIAPAADHSVRPVKASRPATRPVVNGNDDVPRNFAPLRTLAHNSRVLALACSPDGSLLAAAYGDGAINLWNPSTGALVRTIATGDPAINHMAFAASKHLLVTSAADKTWSVWDIDRGSRVVRSAGAMASGPVVFFPDDDHVAIAETDGIGLCDAQDARVMQEVPIGGHVLCMDAASEGPTLAVGSDNATLALFDKTLTMTASKTPTLTAAGNEALKHRPYAVGAVYDVHFAPSVPGKADAPRNVLFADDYAIWEWNRASDRVTVRCEAANARAFAATSDGVAWVNSAFYEAPASETSAGSGSFSHTLMTIAAAPTKGLFATGAGYDKDLALSKPTDGTILLFGPEILPEIERHIRFHKTHALGMKIKPPTDFITW
ncbi:MAG TPA: hypothetical protein VHQ47_00575 [Phycisphaerae bacterium]|nr:hypothetical protein [Phycisphaerae bacterium]